MFSTCTALLITTMHWCCIAMMLLQGSSRMHSRMKQMLGKYQNSLVTMSKHWTMSRIWSSTVTTHLHLSLTLSHSWTRAIHPVTSRKPWQSLLVNFAIQTMSDENSLISYLEHYGVDMSKLKGNNFPWKTLLLFLASKSLVLEGYPHGVLMPGQSHHEGMHTKGINDLTLAEKQQLLSTIKGKRHMIQWVGQKELCKSFR